MSNGEKKEGLITFLPEDSGEVESPGNRGQWESIRELLKKLSDGLVVPKGASADALTAIPTVWARPILFAQALTDDKHPLHREVVAEWRGKFVVVLDCWWTDQPTVWIASRPAGAVKGGQGQHQKQDCVWEKKASCGITTPPCMDMLSISLSASRGCW